MDSISDRRSAGLFFNFQYFSQVLCSFEKVNVALLQFLFRFNSGLNVRKFLCNILYKYFETRLSFLVAVCFSVRQIENLWQNG